MLITKCYNLPGTPNSQQNVSTIFAMQFSWRLTNLANVILQREVCDFKVAMHVQDFVQGYYQSS